MATVRRNLTANGVEPTFLSGHTFGATNTMVARPSSQDKNKANKKEIAILERERTRLTTKGYLKANSQVILWKERDDMKFYLPLLTRHCS